MRALISAQMLAADSGACLVVLWKRDHHLNCRFEELFEKPEHVMAVFHVRANRFYRLLNFLLCRLFPRRLEQSDIEMMNKQNADFLDLARGESLMIRTYSRFYCDCDYSLLQPLPWVRQKVARYALKQNQVVGVHIRRTDHNVSIANSPDELFVEAMQSELERRPDTTFFLATDSPAVEKLMCRVFADRIISHPKTSLDRNNAEAIKDALVDLYCLAECRKLIGSYWSSFTDTAAAMKRIEVKIIRADKGPETGPVRA
jgi:hypothetical protein